jgi:hypothetical protein
MIGFIAKTNQALGLRGEQLCRGWLTPKISYDYVRIQENEGPLTVRAAAVFGRSKFA